MFKLPLSTSSFRTFSFLIVLGLAAPAMAEEDVASPAAPQVSAVQVGDRAPANLNPEILIDDALIAMFREWTKEPVFQISTRASNEIYAGITQDRIDRLDREWMDQRKKEDQPLVASIMGNPLSARLMQLQASSYGLVTEIIAMDAYGLNTGLSAISSDFWQGDEAKWQKTYAVGPDAVFIDEAEYFKDVGVWTAQVNLTVNDVDTGMPIGALTIEVNLNELRRRRGLGLM